MKTNQGINQLITPAKSAKKAKHATNSSREATASNNPPPQQLLSQLQMNFLQSKSVFVNKEKPAALLVKNQGNIARFVTTLKIALVGNAIELPPFLAKNTPATGLSAENLTTSIVHEILTHSNREPASCAEDTLITNKSDSDWLKVYSAYHLLNIDPFFMQVHNAAVAAGHVEGCLPLYDSYVFENKRQEPVRFPTIAYEVVKNTTAVAGFNVIN